MHPSWWSKFCAYSRSGWQVVMRLIDAETYSKQRIFLLLVLLAILVSWRQLLGGYNQYVISPVLSKVVSNPLTDLAFILLDGAILLFFIAKVRIGYRLSAWQRTVLLVPGFLYSTALYYAGNSPATNWRFHTFQWVNQLRYADALLLLLTGGIILVGCNMWGGLAAIRPSNSFLREDNPLANVTDDTLNRLPEARRVAQQITSLATSTSFAIGVLGKWGEGKSSFLKLIEWQLNEKQTIIIHFNPWLVESTAAIRKDFFATLKERLGDYSGELASELSTYANGLASVYDNTAAKAVKEAVSVLWDTSTLTEQFEKVNRVIARLRKKIVIFIDDIDRLDKDEVLETLRIVRNTASFGNTIFVLAYDKQYVTNAVQLTNQANSSQYLDKIVQLEIPLPPFDAVRLARRTLDIIQQSPPELQAYHAALAELLIGTANSRPAASFMQHYTTQMSSTKVCFYPEIIITMRSAIRFTNLFTFDFLPLAKEVRLDEMVNLTLLKFKYPALHEAIKSKRIVTADFDIGYSESIMKVDEEGLNTFYETHPTEKGDKILIEKLLKHLFGSDRLAPGQRTIQRPSSFAVYFSAGHFDNVPLVELEQLRLGPVGDIRTRLAAWHVKGQLEEAFDVLVHEGEFNNRNDFENVVVAVFEAGKQLDRSITEWLLSINSKSRSLLTTLYNQDTAAFGQFFERQFTQAELPFMFEANLAFNIKAEMWRGNLADFLLTKDQLGRFTLDYLRKYLIEKQLVDNTAFNLYQCNGTAVNQHNYIIINPDANEPMRQAIETHLDSALQSIVIPTGQPPLTQHLTFRPFLDQIFGSWATVDTFIDTLPDSEITRQVQIDYRSYKESGYREFIKLNPTFTTTN